MALTDNLVSYWKMDETSGTRNDAHTGANHLSDPTSVASAAGKINNGADFERSSSQYLTIADNASLSLGSNTDFTFTCWIKHEDYTQGMFTILTKHDDDPEGTPTASEYALYSNFGTIKFYVANGSSLTLVTWGTQITDALFHFIRAGYSSADQKVYLQVDNGTTIFDNWTGGTHDTAFPFGIGGLPSIATYFDGVIDEVGFWKGRFLSDSESTQLWNSGAGLPYSSFGGGAGATIVLMGDGLT